LGYREEYPDYLTQGESLEDLQERRRDMYADLAEEFNPARFCARPGSPVALAHLWRWVQA